eukprot:220774_1
MVVMESNTRLKYLIYGYFRHITDDFIPSVITDICLKFYDSSDRWNKSLMSDNVIIYNNDCIKLTSHSLARIYLINTIDTGIYKWTFKLICYHSVDSQVLNIGIHKIAIKSSVQKDNWNQIPNSGYLFDFDDGRLMDPISIYGYGPDQRRYGKTAKIGYTIDMILNLDKRTLSYNINGKPYGIAFKKIAKTAYIAVIHVNLKNTQVQLVASQYLRYHAVC